MSAPIPALTPAGTHLVFRTDLQLVILRCEREQTAGQIQSDYLHLLAMAERHRCHAWLLDLRGRRSGGENDYWVLNTFLPLAAGAMPGLIRMAYLLAPSHHEQVMGRLPKSALAMLDAKVRVHFSVSEKSAIDWLCTRQAGY